jgi:ribonucleoside-triphosphate reductase
MDQNIVKRDGTIVPFDAKKIETAILKAMKYGSGIVRKDVATEIANDAKIVFAFDEETPDVYQIEDFVYFALLDAGEELTAKSFEGYRAVQAFKRESRNTTDQSILGLISLSNEDVMNENSNKNAMLVSTQRDLIAGEVSKDLAKRAMIPTEYIQAHNDGILHWHDMDYTLQPMFNCCLINLEDMLDNGTVINEKLVESPKSFSTACTIATQIIAQVASSQYGGQSISIKPLARYLRKSYENRHYRMSLRDQVKYLGAVMEHYGQEEVAKNKVLIERFKEIAKESAKEKLMRELKDGVQTIRYQLSTLMTTNGQSPFVTIYLEIEEGHAYEEEMAMICEEMLNQRIEGMKNEYGQEIGEAFPKLVYLLDEHNCLEGGKYDYLTELAAECTAKRLVPDYQSAKIMRMNYEGNTFPPMGCRSHLGAWKDANGNYKFDGRFNQGVISLNLAQIGLIAKESPEIFWDLLDERLELCKNALMERHKLLRGTVSDVSPIHWRHGAIARLRSGETIDRFLDGGYSTISLGYVGVYEMTLAMLGVSHTTDEGKDFALKVMKHMNAKCKEWKAETGLGFALYGTPAESLVYRFCKIDKKKFGEVEGITDKLYYTNSYHVFVGEEIDAFAKLEFESEFHGISTGGCISYIEVPNMVKNLQAVKDVINYIYHNVQYAEINSRPDVCYECGFRGEILINDKLEWYCPCCNNKEQKKMQVMRRTCGYIGSDFWNKGKTQEIAERVLHL